LGANAVLLTVEEFGCEESYVDSVIINPRPEMEVATDRAGCAGVPFQFSATGVAWTPIHYAWAHGDGTFSNDQEHEHDFDLPGTYDVSLTIWTEEGCIDQQSSFLPNWIEVFPIPVAEFTVEPDEVSLLDPLIEVVDHAQLANVWNYSIDGISINTPSFSHYFDDAGQYAITQVVTSGDNCSNSITHTVFVTDHLFFAPNAFTPNGDGHNDTFAPQVKGARLYEIVILDRWGVERFHSTDPKAEWNGDGQPEGVYTYKVRLAEYGAYRKEYNGHVTLLR
jgi:gliding motility-associated-like protein